MNQNLSFLIYSLSINLHSLGVKPVLMHTKPISWEGLREKNKLTFLLKAQPLHNGMVLGWFFFLRPNRIILHSTPDII